MKLRFLSLIFGAMLSILSVSCSASPPSYDIGYVQHEPTIKQMATEQMPIELTITPDAYAMEIKMVELSPVQLCNDVKPKPMVISVCSTCAPIFGVDGRALLSWCVNHYATSTIPNIGFHYIEGIATEYSC